MTADKPKPLQSPKSAGAAQARRQRLADALRENLKRRKAQARSREAAEPAPGEPRKPA